jgi:hypothetical protein
VQRNWQHEHINIIRYQSDQLSVSAKNRKRYNLYLSEAESLRKKVLFAGRLADYKYYNMDQAVARALGVFEKQVAGDAENRTRGPGFPLQP